MTHRFKHLKHNYRRTVKFITHDIWYLDHTGLGKRRSWLYRYFKAILITLKNCGNNRVGQKASALTFISILATVPLIAFILGFADLVGLTPSLRDFMYNNLQGLEQVVDSVLRFAQNIISTSRNGLFGFIGAAVFFWSVIWVTFCVERNLNDIWQVERNRSWSRHILFFIIVLLAIPIVALATAYFILFYTNFMDHLPIAPYYVSSIKPFVGWGLFTVFMITVFFIVFKFFPNTLVRKLPALNAAIITGVAFVIIQVLYVETQIFFTRLNAIYGAFAAIPLFMVWFNITWNVVLIGAELSYAFQNASLYDNEYEQRMDHPSAYQRKAVALAICRLLCQRFKAAEGPVNVEELARELMLPLRLIHASVRDLCEAGLVIQVQSHQYEDLDCYQPAMDPDDITVALVAGRIDRLGEGKITGFIGKNLRAVTVPLNKAEKLFEASPENKELTAL